MDLGQKPDATTMTGADASAVRMRYRGNGSAQIRGPVTGQIYQFPRQQPVQDVDARDVRSLVRTRLFTPVECTAPRWFSIMQIVRG